ncbi:hypothetical protein [Faecalimicrobium sp. JNUCC 81]
MKAEDKDIKKVVSLGIIGLILMGVLYLLPLLIISGVEELFRSFYQYQLFEKQEHYVIFANYIRFMIVVALAIYARMFYKNKKIINYIKSVKLDILQIKELRLWILWKINQYKIE